MTSKTQQPRFDAIPEELRRLPNWVCWRREKRASKSGVRETKVPYNARTGKLAKTNDPDTWSSSEEALAAFQRGGVDGLGFCFTRPYVGFDLDGCRSVDGVLEPWAEEIIRELDSYTELSPGDGVHGIVKGDLPDGPRQKEFGDRPHHGVGLYDAARGRYFTVTGCRISGDGTIAERTTELHRIHARLFPPKPKAKKKAKAGAGTALPDDDLIERARNANDGGKFARLWDGQWDAEYPSQSEADLALCFKLAFWTGRDAARIDALFRRSSLMRDKWLRNDYRERTIETALARQTETYRPQLWAHVAAVNLDALTASVETLNALTIFGGKIRFLSVKSRGPMIVAVFAKDREAIWPSTRDLLNFTSSQALIAEATGIVMPSPSRRSLKAVWEPAAQLILQLAGNDRVSSADRLRDEFQQILYATWKRAGCPTVGDKDEFFDLLTECVNHKRKPHSEPPRCAIWHDQQDCYVHQPTLLEWLSTPVAKSKHYDWGEVQKALLLLEFKPEQVHRTLLSENVKVRLWRGPMVYLIDDETPDLENPAT